MSEKIRRRRKLSKKKVIEALQKAKGIKALAARSLRVHRRTIDYWINEYPEVREVYEEVNEVTIDEIEGHLIANCRTPGKHQQRAIEFYLVNKAKHRGYGKSDADGEVDKVIVVQHSIPGFESNG